MKFTNIKQQLLMGAVIFGLGIAPQIAQAVTVDNVDVDATVSVVGALDVVKVHDLAFGSWYYIAGSAPSTIAQDTTGSATPVSGGTGGTLTPVGAHAQAGELTVKITGGAAAQDNTIVQMTIGTITPFTQDPALVLSNTIDFKAGTAAASTATAGGAAVPVNIELGATAENIKLGGTLTLDGAVTGTDTASFNVGFAY